MKKKQGFTLVELLAVIAILAILVIIALPNVLRMFRNAKENTFVTEVQEILKTAEQKYISTAFTENECTCFSSKSTDKKHNLDMSGRNNIEYYVEFNDKGEVINLIVKDDSYQFVSEGEVIKVADIGNSTSGKKKTSTPVQETMEVPSCDGSSGSSKEEVVVNPQYDSMLKQDEMCDFTEASYLLFCVGYYGETKQLFRYSIENLIFTNTNKVPEGVLGFKDVSDDDSGNIMMWWTDKDEDDLYEVTIGGEGGVRANTDSSDLFEYMSDLTSIDLTYLDTSEVTNMNNMFNGCSSLPTLNLSSFSTSKVTNMRGMFAYCDNLQTITYGDKFVINEDTNIKNMFYETEKLENDKFKSDLAYADRFNGD